MKQVGTRVFCGVVVLLCLLGISYAQEARSFSVDVEVLVQDIYFDEVAKAQLTIKNHHSMTSRFQIYSTDPRWIVGTEPNEVEIAGGQSKSVTVFLDPSSSINSIGVFGVPIEVKALQTGDTRLFKTDILVKSDRFRQYLPSVFLSTEVGDDGKVRPDRPVEVKLRVVNRNPLQYSTFVIDLHSPLFNDTYRTDLAGNGDFVKVLTYEIDQRTPPQNLTLEVTMGDGIRQIGSPQRLPFSVIPIYPPFYKNKSSQEGFLKGSWQIQFANVGNVLKKEQLFISLSRPAQWFTRASHEYESVVRDGVSGMLFDIELAPGEATTVNVNMDARPFALFVGVFACLVAVVAILYYLFRSPLVVVRKVVPLSKEQEGGITKIKVLLNVKNRTNKTIENVRVFERLPHITKVDDEFEIGTVKPSKVLNNAKKGTLVRWDFAAIEPYEERIVTYKLQSSLSILGDLRIAPTVIKFASGSKVRTVEFKNVDIRQ
ncbi:MAG: hypothetical protein ACOCWQ_02645 [Nanoarchaeota archaeon]